MTDNQKNIVDFIRKFSDENRYAPTLAEIGAGVGLTSMGVKWILLDLRNQGIVSWTDGKARTIQLKEVKR